MTSDRWHRVEELYNAASEKPAADRGGFLSEACSGDSELRREVEELLEQSEISSNILDRPVRQLLEQAELQVGQTLGPYRVLGLVGSGGMGHVYKAFDTRLGRPVAIKVSRAEFSGRFRREARAVAALNHPHICTLYDLGPSYLVMEFVEGRPLGGPLPLAEALKVSIAIADALDAAHSKGVIHRDLKPANILLTRSGPKLLDFGLAKMELAPGSAPDSVTWASTAQTTIAGTIQYMSPEQLQGRGADVRSDIFSFGLVLFEMLTGRPAFEADNSASLIAAILTAQPKARKLTPAVPVEVERIIDRALAKDPEKRWQTAREMKEALERAAVATAPRPVPRYGRALRVAAVVAVLGAAVLAWSYWGWQRGLKLDPVTGELTPSSPPQLVMFDRSGKVLGAAGLSADYSNPALSPDGQRLAVSIRGTTRTRDIWIFDFSKGAQTRFTSHPGEETNPVWSPDGSEIVYCSDRSGRRDLYTASLAGGPERLLLASDQNKNPLDWARDGSAIYYNNDRTEAGHEVWMLPLTGEKRTPRVFLSDSDSRDWLALSPDSRLLLYRAGRNRVLLRTLLPGSGDWPIAATTVPEGHWRSDSREIYFISGDSMMAQEVEVDGGRIRLQAPVRLFRVPKPNTFGRNSFINTPDGKRFLIRTGR